MTILRFLCHSNREKMVLGRRTGEESARHPTWVLPRTGFVALVWGLCSFMCGAFEFVQYFRPGSLAASGAVFFPALLCVIAAAVWGWQALKRRFAAGLVEPPGKWWPAPDVETTVSRWSLLPLAAFLALLVLKILGHAHSLDHRLMNPGYAALIGMIVLGQGWVQKNALLLFAFSAYLMFLALVQWPGAAPMEPSMAILSVGAGAPIAIAGAFRLRSVLKANPCCLRVA